MILMEMTERIEDRCEAVRHCALNNQADQIAAAFEAVEMDFRGSARAWRYGGGRDLSRLVEDARATRDSNE